MKNSSVVSKLSGIFGQRSHFPASHTGEISISLCVISFPQKMRFHYVNTNKGIQGTSWRDATEHETHVLTRMRHLLPLGSALETMWAHHCTTVPARCRRALRGRAGTLRRAGKGCLMGKIVMHRLSADVARTPCQTEGPARKQKGSLWRLQSLEEKTPHLDSWKEVGLDYSVTLREDPKKTQKAQQQNPLSDTDKLTAARGL